MQRLVKSTAESHCMFTCLCTGSCSDLILVLSQPQPPSFNKALISCDFCRLRRLSAACRHEVVEPRMCAECCRRRALKSIIGLQCVVSGLPANCSAAARKKFRSFHCQESLRVERPDCKLKHCMAPGGEN